MKIDPAEHRRLPFRVHELAAAEGLTLHDVWQVDQTVPADWSVSDLEQTLRGSRLPLAVRALVATRRAVGRVLRLDEGSEGFRPVYDTAEERLYRISNRTATAFAHVSIVERHPRIAVYVRPHGSLGSAYMHVIEPFRRYVVYPQLLAWAARSIEVAATQR